MLSSKLSPRLQQIMQRSDAGATVPLNISIQPRLDPSFRNALIGEIREFAEKDAAAEYIPLSETVHCRLRLSELEAIANMSQVEWIDVEKERPIEELLD